MLSPKALPQDEGVLRADRHDEAEAQEESGDCGVHGGSCRAGA
jgi:hypothetical protein